MSYAVGADLRRRVNDLVTKGTDGVPHGALVNVAVQAVLDQLARSMYGLACDIDAPMAERVPAQRLAMRLIGEALALTGRDFAAAMAAKLEAA